MLPGGLTIDVSNLKAADVDAVTQTCRFQVRAARNLCSSPGPAVSLLTDWMLQPGLQGIELAHITGMR